MQFPKFLFFSEGADFFFARMRRPVNIFPCGCRCTPPEQKSRAQRYLALKRSAAARPLLHYLHQATLQSPQIVPLYSIWGATKPRSIAEEGKIGLSSIKTSTIYSMYAFSQCNHDSSSFSCPFLSMKYCTPIYSDKLRLCMGLGNAPQLSMSTKCKTNHTCWQGQGTCRQGQGTSGANNPTLGRPQSN